MKILTTILTAVLLLTACNSKPEPTKRQLIEQYRTEHGENWNDWGEETKAEFKREMKRYE